MLLMNMYKLIAWLPVRDGDGVPWFVITEPDGTILGTSESPLGNIGFPGSVEGIRHFRRMLDRTVQRLEPDEVVGRRPPFAGQKVYEIPVPV
jgi:hypothetical protein